MRLCLLLTVIEAVFLSDLSVVAHLVPLMYRPGGNRSPAGNVHQVAGQIAPKTRVIYVDNDHCESGCAHRRGRPSATPPTLRNWESSSSILGSSADPRNRVHDGLFILLALHGRDDEGCRNDYRRIAMNRWLRATQPSDLMAAWCSCK